MEILATHYDMLTTKILVLFFCHNKKNSFLEYHYSCEKEQNKVLDEKQYFETISILTQWLVCR